MIIAKKILMFVLMLSILVVIRYILRLVKAFRLNQSMDRNWKDELLLGSAISYILTIIFTGFQLF